MEPSEGHTHPVTMRVPGAFSRSFPRCLGPAHLIKVTWSHRVRAVDLGHGDLRLSSLPGMGGMGSMGTRCPMSDVARVPPGALRPGYPGGAAQGEGREVF